MMQMLHSAYDLQESMEFSESRLVMNMAKQCRLNKNKVIAYLQMYTILR